ncbi:Protein of unknown function [Cotesia congregata]|uniref:Uncharacterized protein n=1 Tax=Cotesia congregata TaxID=51543 RepID=A0A8J2MQN3_COTCN|nr:Protein of unknown function [Cotesia congregata]
MPPCYYSPAGVCTYQLRISRHQLCCNTSGQAGRYVAATSKLQWLRHWLERPRSPIQASPSKWRLPVPRPLQLYQELHLQIDGQYDNGFNILVFFTKRSNI